MSDDKLLACLLSDNNHSKDSCSQDSSASPTKDTISCDKNGNFDESTEEFIIDKEARRLSVSSVESSSENPNGEPCNSHTEAEINSAKETVVNNKVDNASNPMGMESNLEKGYSKDAVMCTVETSHVETATVMPQASEQQHSIEIKATDTLSPQQSQDVSYCQQVQQPMDSVLHTIETPCEETTTVVSKQQEIETKSTDSISSQQVQDILENLQAQQPQDSVLHTIETPCEETTTVVSKQQEIETKSTDSISSQQVQDILDNLQAQQPQTNSNDDCLKYREDADSSDDDTSSTFSLSSSSDCSDSFLEKMHRSCSPGNKIPNIKTKGELDLDELPPIEDLTIDITEREMQKVGTIYAVVDKLVIVRALKDLQPLDLDSVLFLSHKKTLGRIFDVFGPVVEPFYSVRFNSSEHIAEKTIVIDADVFFAPEKTDITSYVFVDQLRKQKGSDASWQHNNEPPEEFLDYSDDDEERAAKRKRHAKTRNRYQDSDDVQVIPNKVSKGTTPKNSEEINPWVDIKLSLNSTPQRVHPNLSRKNPFQRTNMASQAHNTTNFAKPPAVLPMSSERYANHGPERYGTMASQGGTNVPTSFLRPQNVPAPQQNMQPQYPPQPASMQRGPIAVSSAYFPHQKFAIQSCPSSPYLQPMVSPLQQPVMNFMHQPPMSPHPGMAPNHRFGQVPYFNSGSPSLMGMPPPPVASPVAFAIRPDARVFMNQSVNFPSQLGNFPSQPNNFPIQPGNFPSQPGNFPSQPGNFPSQPGNFPSQPGNFPSQPGNFSSQASHFLNRAMNQPANFVNSLPTLQQNSLLGQPGRVQLQNGPPIPYAMTPLSISIPSTPPSNAIYTPVPSPYNMWGSKSLNIPQSGYFRNNLQ